MQNEELTYLFEEMIAHQRKKLLKVARSIVPKICEDDLMQPFDFPELEGDPLFRYEEGILHGLISAQVALNRELIDLENSHMSGASL